MEIILARLSGLHVESRPGSKSSDDSVQSMRALSTHVISGNVGNNASRTPAAYGQAGQDASAYGQATYGQVAYGQAAYGHGQVNSSGYSVSNSCNSNIGNNRHRNNNSIGKSNSGYGDSSRIKGGMGNRGTGQIPGSGMGPGSGSGSGALITEEEILRLTHTR
jgi:hypothetical protein